MDTTPESNLQGRIPGMLIRGGTSKGLFVREEDLPLTGDERDELVLELFGTPDPLQVDGVGGSHSHTSKLMVVEPSARDGVDVDYTFGQVGIDKPTVDYSGNCGNLTSAIGVFAILEGIVEARDPETPVTLYNTNTNTVVEQTVPVRDGEPDVYGDYAIDGVPGTGARIDSCFLDPAGGVGGALFPTGEVHETVTVDGEEYEVSVVDVANPNVFVRAEDLGLEGTELPDDIRERRDLVETVEAIRAEGCYRMGLVDDPADAELERPGIPQIALVSEPQSYECSVDKSVEADEIDVTSRIFTNQRPHHAYAMTGAMCLAAAVRLPGTVPNRTARSGEGAVTIGHPKGTITVGVERGGTDADPTVESVTVGRTTRPIMHGQVYYRYVDGLEALREEREAAVEPPAE